MKADGASVVNAAIQAEHERLRRILGFGVEKEMDGFTIDYEPIGNLEEAIIDLEREGADKACIRTIKKVQARLQAFEKHTEPKTRRHAMSADKPSITTSDRIVIKLEDNANAETVIGSLEAMGFAVESDLAAIGVLLGRYSGDLADLETIEGIAVAAHDVKIEALKE